MANNQQTQKKRTGLYFHQIREIRAKILFEQDFGCWDCGTRLGVKKGDYHLHHLNKRPKDNNRGNLIVLCIVCHWFIHGFQDSVERGLQPKKKKPRKKDKNKNQTKLEIYINE